MVGRAIDCFQDVFTQREPADVETDEQPAVFIGSRELDRRVDSLRPQRERRFERMGTVSGPARAGGEEPLSKRLDLYTWEGLPIFFDPLRLSRGCRNHTQSRSLVSSPSLGVKKTSLFCLQYRNESVVSREPSITARSQLWEHKLEKDANTERVRKRAESIPLEPPLGTPPRHLCLYRECLPGIMAKTIFETIGIHFERDRLVAPAVQKSANIKF